MADLDQDLIEFADEPTEAVAVTAKWRILIVDDEPDVHAATTLALRDTPIEGRQCHFLHAYSGQEALDLLRQESDIAVALIDVVMETEDAGLQLVKALREELGLKDIRVILRTGQPGYAPEIDTIKRHDINDYKTKSELTRIRLFTSLSMAIRSYAQIQQLHQNQKGLEHILQAALTLSREQQLDSFLTALALQVQQMLGLEPSTWFALNAQAHPNNRQFLAASETNLCNQVFAPLEDAQHNLVIEQCLEHKTHQLSEDKGLCLYLASTPKPYLLFLALEQPLTSIEQQLLPILASHASAELQNLQLYWRINDLAYRDALVDLPNRNGLLLWMDNHSATGQQLALIDLDGFADLNSILDDSFGDLVLQSTALHLRQHFSAKTCVARIGSDIFALYGPKEEVNSKQIMQLFAEPFINLTDESLRISATCGLIDIDINPGTSIQRLKNAGAALKEAKLFHRGQCHFFQQQLADAAKDRMQLLNRLRQAFSSERLQLYYQPQYDLTNGQMLGAEALLRWQTDDGRFIPPDRFIPLAEQSGLMAPLGDWVIRTALKWRAELKSIVADSFRVAINVSQIQFNDQRFVETLLSHIQQQGLEGYQVEIELTESVAIEKLELVREKLTQLQQFGIQIALDDFGTGYSSLSILQHLPLNRLKIDRSFVSGQAEAAQNLAETIIALAKQLKLNTIAEGIETPEQQEWLRQLGCQEGQGYYYSPPVSPESFQKLLTNKA